MSTESSDIIILIDESGSMKKMGDEPLHALNSFIKDQKKTGSLDSKLTICKFNNKVTVLLDKVLLSEVEEITDFYPYGMTSLYDAIGRSIIDNQSTRNVTCVILTDGYNNASVEFNAAMIRKLVIEREDYYGWVFHFLGANQDSFTSGRSIGIQRCATFSPVYGSIDDITTVLRNTSIEITKERSKLIFSDSPPPPPPQSSPSYTPFPDFPYSRPLLSRQSSTSYR
jgi:hypothetical protein